MTPFLSARKLKVGFARGTPELLSIAEKIQVVVRSSVTISKNLFFFTYFESLTY